MSVADICMCLCRDGRVYAKKIFMSLLFAGYLFSSNYYLSFFIIRKLNQYGSMNCSTVVHLVQPLTAICFTRHRKNGEELRSDLSRVVISQKHQITHKVIDHRHVIPHLLEWYRATTLSLKILIRSDQGC